MGEGLARNAWQRFGNVNVPFFGNSFGRFVSNFRIELKKEDTTRYGSSDTVSCLVVFVARRPVRLGSSRGDRIACCYSTRKTGDEMFYYGRRFRNMNDGRG